MEQYDYAMAGDYYEDGMVRRNTPLLIKRDATTPPSTTRATNGCFFAVEGRGDIFGKVKMTKRWCPQPRMHCWGGEGGACVA